VSHIDDALIYEKLKDGVKVLNAINDKLSELLILGGSEEEIEEKRKRSEEEIVEKRWEEYFQSKRKT